MEEIKKLKETIFFLERDKKIVERAYQERIIRLEEVNSTLSKIVGEMRLKYEKGSFDNIAGDAGSANH